MKNFSIFGREVGEGRPTLIIAEAGLNHNGQMSIAKELIDVAADALCDVVKFQKRDVPNLVTKEFMDSADTRFPSFGRTYRQIREYVEFSERELLELKEYAQSKDIAFLATPFDIPSAQMLERIGVEAYKSASHNLTHLPLLEHLAKQGKPIIASTGMSTPEEVDGAVAVLQKYQCPFALLHCVSSYPTRAQLINLRGMDYLRERYGVPVGYSGHEDLAMGYLPTLAAVARGAAIVERHITLDTQMEGFDHKLSVDPSSLKNMVRDIRLVDTMLGSGGKQLLPEEMVKRDQQRVSIVAAHSLPANTVITQDMLAFKGPGTGIAAYKVNEVVGRSTKEFITEDTLITFDMLV